MNVAVRRRVVILGSTGSIGRQALDVVRTNSDLFDVVGLCAGSDARSLEAQVEEFGSPHFGLGEEAAVRLAALEEADVVLNAIVGAAGLRASVAALEAGQRLALANKESLVAGGEVCLRAAAQSGGEIVPVDSEHAAIAQALQGVPPYAVSRVVLTASGGPFRRRSDLRRVRPEEALNHPTWSMGKKITVDSASLMNKGLEVIEAHHLFGLDYDRIGVVVHPQSIVHGIVELTDGTTLLHAAPADMRIPIQAALGTRDTVRRVCDAVDLTEVGTLQFEPLDSRRFRAVGLCYEAGRQGLSYPAVLNAANEEAVHAFLNARISFTDIPGVIESVLSSHEPVDAKDLASVLGADRWARQEATRLVRARSDHGNGSVTDINAARSLEGR